MVRGYRDMVLRPLVAGEMECKPMEGKVLGWVEGETCHGRGLVVVQRCPEVFGCPPGKDRGLVVWAMHNGLLNHMNIRRGRDPTPYWAVMDAMITLRAGFSGEEVLSKAMGMFTGREDQGRLLDACRSAWYVLKSHQTHPKERDRGMGYIVDEVEPFRFICRARRAGEMQGVFDEGMRGRMAARHGVSVGSPGRIARPGRTRVSRGSRRGSGKVLATHVVHEVR